MNGHVPDKQSGFVLLAVVLAITVLAAIAFALSHQGASQVNTAAGELQSDQLRYVSEAGLQHAKWQLAQNSSCTTYANLPATPFGLHSYSATIAPTSGSPVSVAAQGTLVNGAQHTLQSDQVSVYEASSVLTLQPDTTAGEDTHIYEWKSAWNYGTAATLRVENNIAGDWSNALLKFDLSSIPASAKIISATLVLNQSSPAAGGGDFSIHRVTNPWVEGVMNGGQGSPNWTNRDIGVTWATLGGDYDPAAVTTINIPAGLLPHQWEVAALVQSWVSGDSLNFGMAIVPASFGSDAFFHSSDASNAALRPKLTITYACECGVSGSSSTLVLQPGLAGKEVMLRGTQNYGAAPYTWIDTSVPYHSLYEFDLPSLAPGAMVTSALLDIHQSSADAVTLAADLDVHRVTTTWVEGTGDNSGLSPADGVTWFTSDGTTPWNSAGGDYDSTVIDSAIVNSTSNTWHQWNVKSLVQSWVDGTYPNYGFLLRASSGDLTKLYLDTGEDNDPAVYPKLTIHYSCPCGTVCSGGGGAAGNLLLIVGDATTLSTKDAGYKTLIESWGYTVSVIDDGASQADYDTAMAPADVIYASGSALGANMLDKATYTTKGVVNEVNGKIDNFGFSSSTSATVNTDNFSLTNPGHYITQPFAVNPVTIFTASLTNPVPGGTLAPGLQKVGFVSSTLALGTLEAGAIGWNGDPVPGRRAHLPFASAETTDMTADGKTILQRALEWAAGADGGNGPAIILATHDVATLGGLAFTPADLVEYDTISDTATMYFNGATLFSDPLQKVQSAHVLSNGHIILSTRDNATLGGLSFTQADLVEYDSITDTATLYFNGAALFSDPLTRIASAQVLNSGQIILSTWNDAALGGLTFSPAQLVVYDPPTDTAQLYFDGETLFDDPLEKIDAVHVLSNKNIVLSTWGVETLGGLSFGEGDLVEYDTNSDTATLYFDGAANFADPFMKLVSAHINADAGPPDAVPGGGGGGGGGPLTPIFETFSELATGGTSLSINVPAGATLNDLLIAAVATDADTSAVLTAQAGWTQLSVASQAGQVTLGVWWKLAITSEPASYIFDWAGGGSEQVSGVMIRISNVDTVNPINAFTEFGEASQTPISPSVTSTVNHAMILRIGGFDDDDITADTPGLTGHTTINMNDSGNGPSTASVGSGYALQPIAGASGTSNFALTATEEARTVTISIAPPP